MSGVHAAGAAARLSAAGFTPYRVGVGRADITPAVGVPLGGYGARHGTSDRVSAPLRCTAFVFGDDDATLCVVTCDLLYATADIVTAVRAEAAARAGLPPGAVLLTATHTHSGPANLTDDEDGDYVRFVARRAGDAIEAAAMSAEPATVRVSTAELTGISMNRRDPAGPIETHVRSIIAESLTDRRTIGVLMNYACHATVLEADNLAVSPDFPGAAVSFVERAADVTAGYLQGCCGAINPVWIDHTPAEAARVGSVLGSVVLRQIADGAGAALTRRAVNLSIEGEVDAPTGPLAGDAVSGHLWSAVAAAKLRRRASRSVAEIDEDISRLGHTAREGAGDTRRDTAQLAALHAERYSAMTGSPHWRANTPAGADGDVVEVSGIGFGRSLALVGIPAEPFLEIDWGIRAQADVRNLVVCGYANGMIGYVPDRTAFDDAGYEVGMSRYREDAADRIVDAGVALLRNAAG